MKIFFPEFHLLRRKLYDAPRLRRSTKLILVPDLDSLWVCHRQYNCGVVPWFGLIFIVAEVEPSSLLLVNFPFPLEIFFVLAVQPMIHL
ncbi:hypothetical protein, partial [Serratia marcescens]|uniref:hypothetical protein n=1 Tax=Serratia marcescens TaxID=615 RepID=UPI0019D6B9E7